MRLCVTGFGTASGLPCDSRPFLKDRKARKFMGPQDELAVVAASRAAEAADLAGAELGDRAGLFLAVGFIPFEQDDIDVLLDASTEGDAISWRRFAADGLPAINPLLTFRCLPNMPAFHVSQNLGIRGPYFVTYPGPGQLYVALDRARDALERGLADIAVVGGVAHQGNFLVRHHFRRSEPPVEPEMLLDSAACAILEREADALRRGAAVRARLVSLRLAYRPHDPFGDALTPSERFEGTPALDGETGPASLLLALAGAAAGTVRHVLEARDGLCGESVWEVARLEAAEKMARVEAAGDAAREAAIGAAAPGEPTRTVP